MKFFIAMCALVALACAHDASVQFDMPGSFAMADADGNGWISDAEFDGLYMAFDDNGDAVINGTEFVHHFMMTNMSVSGSLYIYFMANTDDDVGINKTEVENFMKVFDTGSDGSISHLEYTSTMNMFLSHLAILAPAGPRLFALFDDADADNNGQLTAVEFWAMLSPADTDGDGLLSEEEFVTYWRAKTMDTDDRARHLFKILDFDGAGFGSDMERKAFFAGFDYEGDGTVNKEEFQNSMLNLFARVMRGVNYDIVDEFKIKNLNLKAVFDMMDTDMDSMVTQAEMMVAVNKSDVDHNGLVNLTEFVAAHMQKGFSSRYSLFSFWFVDSNDDQQLGMDDFKNSFHHKDQNLDGSISMVEFNRAFRINKSLLKKAAKDSPKLAAMVYAVDVNGDSELTIDELSNLTAAADPDGDGDISRDDFVHYWSHHTGLSEDFSGRLFHVFDHDNSGVSSAVERTAVFGVFDADGSGTISIEDEYTGAMLYQYTKIVRQMSQEVGMKFSGTFNSNASFHRGDLNHDGFIDSSESQAFFRLLDADNSTKLSLFEFVGGYNKTAGFALHGGLYLFYLTDDDENQEVSAEEFAAGFNSLDADDDMKVTVQEYVAAWKVLTDQMSEASLAEDKYRVMFNRADKDKSGNLSSTEVDAIFRRADNNKDGLLSAAEFKAFWTKTGEPADRTAVMFGLIDGDSDGMYGNDQERQQLFDAMDNDDDNVLSWDDLSHTLLNMFARSVKILEAQRAANAIVGFFF